MEMVEEKKSFKKISVVPSKKDFDDAIVSLFQKHTASVGVLKRFEITRLHRLRQHHQRMVLYAKGSFRDKLSTVLKEFHQIRHYNFSDYFPALDELIYAKQVIDKTAKDFGQLLKKDDCDSLDKCKSLKVAAIGCMYAVAMSCVPSLDYLEKWRQGMARVTEINSEYDKAAQGHFLGAVEDCNVPHTFDVHNVADFVNPQVLRWLGDLEREHGLRLEDDQLDCAAEQLDGCH